MEEMGRAWVEEQSARQARLEALYKESGREDPEHPQHGLYTGLNQQYLESEKCKKEKEFIPST